MARYTTAYSSFVERLGEVERLRMFASSKEKQDPVKYRLDISALCRGAVILLSGHLEAYIKELGELAIDSLYQKSVPREKLCARFFYHISKDCIDEIKDTSDPNSLGEKVFNFLSNDLQFWSRSGSFPISVPADRFNKGFSNPAFKKIKSYFNRFGYSDYQNDLASKLGPDFQPIINMIEHLVETRNKIAHGDPSATKTPLEIKDMISMVKRYCAETDGVFANWWRQKFCAIR